MDKFKNMEFSLIDINRTFSKLTISSICMMMDEMLEAYKDYYPVDNSVGATDE